MHLVGCTIRTVLHVSVGMNHHQPLFIATISKTSMYIVACNYCVSLHAKMYLCFIKVLLQDVPDNGLCEMKHVAQCHIYDTRELCWTIYFTCLLYKKTPQDESE